MELIWHMAAEADLPQLAQWNHQLIRDEGHRNPMTQAALEARMRHWLQGEYRAVIFSFDGEPVAYALFRQDEEMVYLRQFFVHRERRRAGIGRQAIGILRSRVWPGGLRLTVEVLCRNEAAVHFWRSVGYRDYCLTLEIMPP